MTIIADRGLQWDERHRTLLLQLLTVLAILVGESYNAARFIAG